MKKTIKIEIPDGKCAEWRDGVLTLVDAGEHDVTARIKTFEDAVNELDEGHPFVADFRAWQSANKTDSRDVAAYLKLRIIAAALNEGWEPVAVGEERYHPWFRICSAEEYKQLQRAAKAHGCAAPRAFRFTNGYGDTAYAVTSFDPSYTYAGYGSRLAFRTRALACYCGSQFLDLWADYLTA